MGTTKSKGSDPGKVPSELRVRPTSPGYGHFTGPGIPGGGHPCPQGGAAWYRFVRVLGPFWGLETGCSIGGQRGQKRLGSPWGKRF